ncbi:NAD-dependent epimerase/dehydratase family protein, partial [Candidatus Micrarchaeota archaeon]|nr:NAD-dependent epimerase/dehydratase family protein [Candidatus Micrarchaeota archaeon]
GAEEKPMKEEMKPAPETPYAITKLLGEYYANFFFEYHKLPTAVVRYFNVYGPNEYPGKYRNVIPNFFAKALAGQPLPVMGDGSDSRDFTFVDDAVEGTILTAEKPEAVGQTFNIGRGSETKIIDLAKLTNKTAGNGDKIQFVPKRSWDKISRRTASVEKAKKLLGFEAKTPLEQGLHKTFEWIKTVSLK